MSLLRTLLLALLVGAGGFLLGLRADRLFGAFEEHAPEARPATLEVAWRAADRRDVAALRAALASADQTAMPAPRFAAERDLLHAIADQDADAVARLAERHRSFPAGAMALVWLIVHAASPAERADAIERLRAQHPASWLLHTKAFSEGRR